MTGRFDLASADLTAMLAGVSPDLSGAVDAALSLVDGRLAASFGLDLDIDGRLVFGYDSRTTSFEQFLYVDTVGLNRARGDWPDGDPSAGHALSFSVGEGVDPGHAELTAQLQLQLEDLQLSAAVPGLTAPHTVRLENPGDVLRLNAGAALICSAAHPGAPPR